MKKQLIINILTTTLLLSMGKELYSQDHNFKKVNDHHVSSILNNIRKTYELDATNIFVRVYIVSNKSGSAKQPESDEVTDNIYIAVSEFDEMPRQSLFVLKNIFGDTDFTLEKGSNDMVIFSFSYRKSGVRTKMTAEVKIDGILVRKEIL